MASSSVMSREKREAFLAGVHVAVISIAEEGRAPLAVPVWYSYEPGGDVLVVMQKDSRKMVSIEAAGRRFSLCVQDENPPYKYVTVEGPVTNVRPYDKADLLAMATRYLGETGGRAYTDGAANNNGVLLTMTPEHWLSTDYG